MKLAAATYNNRMIRLNFLNKVIRVLVILVVMPLLSAKVYAQELPPPEIDLTDIKSVNPSSLSELSDKESEPDLSTTAKQEPENVLNSEEEDKETDGIRDEDLFGTDENLIETSSNEVTHLIKFDLTGNVVFMTQEKNKQGDIVSGEPYLEVVYHFLFEKPIVLSRNRNLDTIEVDLEADDFGSLAKNEFFDCQLDIDIPKIPVEISSKIQVETVPGEDDQKGQEVEVSKSLILKLDFDSSIREDWFSLCTDFSGTNLNTQGDTEDYYMQILKLLDPSLSAIVIEDYNESETSTVDLSTPQKIINDLDIRNDISLSGSGQIIIEPL